MISHSRFDSAVLPREEEDRTREYSGKNSAYLHAQLIA